MAHMVPGVANTGNTAPVDTHLHTCDSVSEFEVELLNTRRALVRELFIRALKEHGAYAGHVVIDADKEMACAVGYTFTIDVDRFIDFGDLVLTRIYRCLSCRAEVTEPVEGMVWLPPSGEYLLGEVCDECDRKLKSGGKAGQL